MKRSRLGQDGSLEFQESWKEMRKALSIAIKEAKEKCWADVIATVDSDP